MCAVFGIEFSLVNLGKSEYFLVTGNMCEPNKSTGLLNFIQL
jgi:hypothetical protein